MEASPFHQAGPSGESVRGGGFGSLAAAHAGSGLPTSLKISARRSCRRSGFLPDR